MRQNTEIAFLLVLVLVTPSALAETRTGIQLVALGVEEIAAIKVGPDFSMTIVGRGTPDLTPAYSRNSSTHLQYTAIVGTEAKSIQASISAGAVPTGTSLKLSASGFGTNEGNSAGELVLDRTPSDLVTGITSCATGAAAGDGPTLSYTWSIDDAESLDLAAETSVTITFVLGHDRVEQTIVLRTVADDGLGLS